MNNLKEKLVIYGVDYPTVMERFVDDEGLYADCLVSFMDDPAFSALGAALDKNDYHAAFEQAHTLKGVSANLGLTPLYKAICNMVEALRGGHYDGLNVLYDDLLKARETVRKIVAENIG